MTTDHERVWQGAFLRRPFRPARGVRGPHAQTLLARLRRPTRVNDLHRVRWTTPDGDFLDLDFTEDRDPNAPRALVLHGLEGSSRRGYCMQAYEELARAGIAAVGLNFRSCSGEPNRRARGYHSGETGDLAWVVEQLVAASPGRPLGLVGFSLGGNVLMKYLGEMGPSLPESVRAAAAISVPYDLAASADYLEHGLIRRVYARRFLRSLKAKTLEKAHLVGDTIDLDGLDQATTLRRFDDLVTAPLHGFRDAADYYQRSSSASFLPAVHIPTLLVHSLDDPIIPAASLPVRAMQRNPHLLPMLTGTGGHVGFLAGSVRSPRLWAEKTVSRFLAQLLASA